MERISVAQLFSMTVLFQIGTTIIFGFSSTSGRDAWITALLSTVLGVLIIIVYLKLMQLQPGLTLVEWFPSQFGKWIGTPISWMYILLFIYDAGRAAGDIKDLIPVTILPKTPPVAIIATFLALIAYAVSSGIENIGRLSEIWMPIIVGLYIIVVCIIVATGMIDLNHIQPVLSKGWDRIWGAVWPLGITQSFGETIGFAMLWPLVKERNKIFKFTVIATFTSGLLIFSVDFIAILVLGEAAFAKNIYPIYTLIQQVEVADFIENLDSVSVIFFLTTTFFKICIQVFGAVYGMQKLTKAKSSRFFIIPAAIAVAYLGMTMATNVVDHIYVGLKVLPNNLWVPLFYVVPIILLIVTAVRKKIKL